MIFAHLTDKLEGVYFECLWNGYLAMGLDYFIIYIYFFFQQAYILAIAEFVKKNPKAPQELLQKEVEKQIEIFKHRIEDV